MQPLHAEDPVAFGPYRLLARLGAGGMGRVYLARSAGGRTVAVKVVRPELAEDGGFRQRFRQEVEAARAVSGTYTAPVVDADTEGALPWLATAYVLGPSLSDVVERHGPLPETTVRALGAGLAEALVAVHGAGLVHRDLKPSNVLLTADGPRVIDFGIARAVDGDHLTSTGVIVGSPGFIPPEQASGQHAGPGGDVFSLGVVLAYAATGRQPFGQGSAPALLYQVVHADPDLSGVPDGLRGHITPLLAKDPAIRPGPEQVGAGFAAGGAAELLQSWLPGPVASTIAQHAAWILDLEEPLREGAPAGAAGPPAAFGPVPDGAYDATRPGGGTPAPGAGAGAGAGSGYTPTAFTAPRPDPAGGKRSSRRRFLAAGLGTGALALGGGGLAAWLLPGADGGGKPDDDKDKLPEALDAENFTTPPAGTSPEPLWRQRAKPLSLAYDVAPQVIDGLAIAMGDPLLAYDPVTGDKKWSEAGITPGSGIVHSGGLLFLLSADYDGDFVGLDVKTGKEAWRSRLGAGFTNPRPVAADGRHVYVIAEIEGVESAGEGGTVVAAVDLESRKVVWRKQRDPGAGEWSVAATTDGTYLVYADDNYNLTVRSTAAGNQVWTKEVGDEIAQRPALHGDKAVFANQSERTLVAYALDSGDELWSVPSGHPGNGFNPSVSVVDGVVYASVTRHAVFAVNADSGEVLWRNKDVSPMEMPISFVRAEDSVYGASYFDGGGIYAFDAESGELRWRYNDGVNDSGQWQVAAAGSRLIAVHTDNIYGLPAV
ncbi:serine/threonine-protein kinase [Streptomyces sp. NBC_01808]|uniref:serine/threonine-protein kinase n=1 Tax=Streptomyces sp. NBC_01808 TaxID=2975947 RepID=UPI002DD9822D|nr:PQQ-binding-like beta-propeller repeat protein [Streptomyces sp. NBC_01808]WSA38884.1 serine/threonine-protein kinase [Streptomyces sp. NBC_01808]